MARPMQPNPDWSIQFLGSWMLLLAPESHMPAANLMHTAALGRNYHDLILATGNNGQHD